MLAPLLNLLYVRQILFAIQIFYFDNIIDLIGQPGDVLHPAPSLSEVVPMSTYEELTLIVNIALLIVAILSYTHKK